MMVGSQRIMLDSTLGEQAAASFAVRDAAPDILLFGNIGLTAEQGRPPRHRQGARPGWSG
jgi:hypothetical protein